MVRGSARITGKNVGAPTLKVILEGLASGSELPGSEHWQ